MRAVIKDAAQFRQVDASSSRIPSVDSTEMQRLSPSRLQVFAEGRGVRMRKTA
jgi:hypothetical protein